MKEKRIKRGKYCRKARKGKEPKDSFGSSDGDGRRPGLSGLRQELGRRPIEVGVGGGGVNLTMKGERQMGKYEVEGKEHMVHIYSLWECVRWREWFKFQLILYSRI